MSIFMGQLRKVLVLKRRAKITILFFVDRSSKELETDYLNGTTPF